VIPLAIAATLGVALLVTGYVVAVAASGDALAFALIIFLTGVALLLPWGLAGQVPLAVGIVAAYVLALAAGVRGELPAPYGILSVAGGAVTSSSAPTSSTSIGGRSSRNASCSNAGATSKSRCCTT